MIRDLRFFLELNRSNKYTKGSCFNLPQWENKVLLRLKSREKQKKKTKSNWQEAYILESKSPKHARIGTVKTRDARDTTINPQCDTI